MKTIVIIGAGFSGVALASQLARRAQDPLRIVLVNRSGNMARGLAYGTDSPDHLLNVPAGNMSAIAEDPSHFLRFAQSCDSATGPHSFVARSLYGDYLEALLASCSGSSHAVTVERMHDEVAAITPADGGSRVKTASGRLVEADHVVLAFGHFPAPHPPMASNTLLADSRYLRDPWDAGAMAAIPDHAPVLIIGTGLSALDACLTLMKASSTRPVTLVSRRGLLPKAQRAAPQQHARALPAAFRQPGAAPRDLFSSLVRHCRQLATEGQDWRGALDQVRPGTQQLWQGWSQAQRRQFLRHVQPYWDNHRHRAAPGPHERFCTAVKAGLIRVHAGRIGAIEARADALTVHLRQRDGKETALQAPYVINCIGPSTRLRDADNALIGQLLADGLISPDPLGLGIAVDENGSVVGAGGSRVPGVYYIGPLLKARYWEATAVPELRQFASRLASHLLASHD